MAVRGFYRPLLESEKFISLSKGLQKQFGYQVVFGLASSQVSYLTAGLVETGRQPVLFLANGSQSAKKKAADLKTLLPDREVLLFPDLDPVPFGAIAQSREVMALRLKALQAVLSSKDVVLVAPIESLLKKLIPPQVFREHCMTIQVGQRVDLTDTFRRLVGQGYERVDMVEGPGHFSVRGGILDIFPLTYTDPVRIEFFDDEVDSIRDFIVETQRSLEKRGQITIPPAREAVFPPGRIPAALPGIEKEYLTQKVMLLKAGKKAAHKRLTERMDELLEKFRQSAVPEGTEAVFPLLYPDGVTLFDYFPEKAIVFLEEPARQTESLENRVREQAETHTNLLEQGLALPSQLKNYATCEELKKILARIVRVAFSLLPKQDEAKPRNIVHFSAKTMHLFKGKTDLLIEEIRTLKENKFAVIIFAGTKSRAEKIKELFKDHNIFSGVEDGLPDKLTAGEVIITCGALEAGFELTPVKLAVITDWEIYGQSKKNRAARTHVQQGAKISHFSDLRPGDYVVHVNHGIGKYVGIKQLEVDGVRKDYLFVQYAGEDKLYVPTDQIGLIQKYLGAEATAPKLYKLGGAEWHRVKQKVRESVKDLANDLIALYAARQKIPGFKFSPDTVWQREFEDAFPYEETPDQLKAIEEIKNDMETPRPMDRLLCGDVGFGKTEVAVRAAFKAVMDNKQAAVLVPTTILAQQHYNTFIERFAGYPIQVEMLSRFKKAGEQKNILNKVKKGAVDVIIGTHRLLQQDISFKDLGLVIIDEEQRFGVVHKEKLKYLRQNVDVLTLTATPIPRTLHMALIGARDMSILESPPEDRFPVQTYVLEYNLEIVADAIRREINRGGQVYFVHNRVMDIDKSARLLQAVIPEARLVVVHGQMREDQLERRMLDFIAGKYDSLICTTIIETGLDIPNVNTLILDEAEKMGLSQLHQLRGRVGRSHRLAYAYFTYKKDKVLSEIAEKRLHAIREFTEFGAGFKIAMRDLEIRGAGNILGPEQHGHMMAVGFDMYCRLLDEAVDELRGESPEQRPEPNLDLNLNAFISDQYISDPATKIDVYKKIMHIENQADSEDVGEELVDRFGDIPEPVLNLVSIARIKALAAKTEIQSIIQHKDIVNIKFYEGSKIRAEQLAPVTSFFKNRISFAVTPNLQIILSVKGFKGSETLQKLELLLNELTNEVK
ncbi:MAG: transcription-repair coupling factor [Firmicutes bacterium HGW-Firmicutes-8]|nr:MAG: transcription-repair coupling factor [Firmicutes bacterium HGW-Firmicutes-8]